MAPDSTERGRSLGALAARAQLGHREALDALLTRLHGPLRAHILGVVGDGDLADDVAQETLLAIVRHLRDVRDVSVVRAWAYRIATREAVRAARRERSLRSAASGDAITDVADAALVDNPPEPPRLDADELAVLESRLDSLPRAAQVALRLRYLHELSQDEVAAALEVPVGTVKSRIAYGLAMLRKDPATRRLA